jgi:hypothetical protein
VGEENFERACLPHKGMPDAMVVWIIAMKDREGMYGSREEMFQEEKKEERKKKENKKEKRAEKKEKKTELRRRSKAMAIEEAEHHYEEHEHVEAQHGRYYQDHIEERNSDIRKRLYQRSQPARTSRHSRGEKEMQLRRK